MTLLCHHLRGTSLSSCGARRSSLVAGTERWPGEGSALRHTRQPFGNSTFHRSGPASGTGHKEPRRVSREGSSRTVCTEVQNNGPWTAVLRHHCPTRLKSQGGRNLYWDPGSEDRTPDLRALGGGGGGPLASLLTGSGGAISAEFLWLLLGGGGGGRRVVITPSVCRDGELRVLVALGVRGGGLRGID